MDVRPPGGQGTRLRRGYAAATIELPGSGGRTSIAIVDGARADVRQVLRAGQPVDDDIIDRLILPLVDEAVPEWQRTLDALLALPEIGGPVGFAGGVIAIGTRLAVVEPRIVAAILFAGSFIPRTVLEQDGKVTIPLHVLMRDDEGNDRQRALDLFDAFGSGCGDLAFADEILADFASGKLRRGGKGIGAP